MSLKSARIAEVVHDISIEISNTLDPLLRTYADQAGWPPELSAALSVEITNDYKVYVSYPDELAGQIEDLEYGTEYAYPNPVIRPFMYRSKPIVSRIINKHAMEKLSDILEVF